MSDHSAPPKVVVSDRIKQIQADPSGDRTRRALEKQLNALEGGVVVSDEARTIRSRFWEEVSNRELRGTQLLLNRREIVDDNPVMLVSEVDRILAALQPE